MTEIIAERRAPAHELVDTSAVPTLDPWPPSFLPDPTAARELTMAHGIA
ncbi:hypothetical protein [Nocardia tengchongensis]